MSARPNGHNLALVSAPDEDFELLTPDELAQLLSLPVTWVRQQTRARASVPMPHYKLGRYVRFRESEVREWLKSQKRTQRTPKR